MTFPPPEKSGANKNSKNLRFPKELRLSGRENISELFKNSSFFYLRPFKVIYTLNEITSIAEFMGVLFSVPKSRFSKASDRNLIKRRLREAFRLNKHIFFESEESIFLGLDKMALIYQSKDILTFNEIDDKLKLILKRLATIRSK